MKNGYENKDFIGSVKDVDRKKRRVTGYLADFDSMDSHNDIIVSGAFDKTLHERKSQILFLNQHRWDQPHGFFETLTPDSKGLYFESKEFPNTSYSNDAIELYDRRIISQHSIGFIPVKWDFDDENNVRTLKEIKLFEGSNVTVGANQNTPFMGFKALTMEQINDQADRIIKCLHNGTLTDDTFVRLEIALKQLQNESYRRGKADALNEPEPVSTVQSRNQSIATAINIFSQSI